MEHQKAPFQKGAFSFYKKVLRTSEDFLDYIFETIASVSDAMTNSSFVGII